MGYYHDHYLKKDVLLLAVFEKFTSESLKKTAKNHQNLVLKKLEIIFYTRISL